MDMKKKIKYWQPVMGKDWNYALMAPDKHRADTIQNSNSVKIVSQVQGNYNTNY